MKIGRKRMAFITTSLFTISLFSQSLVFASSTEKHIKVKTELGSSSITLNWNNIGTKYEIYRDGKLIENTKQNNYVDTSIGADELYKYVIAAYDDDKLIDTIRVSTKAKSSPEKLKSFKPGKAETTPDMTIESVAGANSVTLNWPAIPDDDNVYDIYRDGVFISKITGNHFVDENLSSSTKYRYSVVGTKKFNKAEIANIKNELKNTNTKEVTDEELSQLENTYEAIKFVKTLSSSLEANLDENVLNESNLMTVSSSSSPYFSFRYLTFIPYQRVKNPWPEWTTPDYSYQTYFLGNNRSFNVLAYQNSKTEQNIDVTFDQPTLSTYNQRTYNDSTTLVDGNNTPLWTGTATCEQSPWYGSDHTKAFDLYLISPNSYGTDIKQFGAGGDCGIPYRDKLSPDITYYYDAWIERDGDWRVKGSHDKAPSHEFYIYDRSTGSYTTIYNHSVALKSNGDPDFNYLLPFYPSWTFDISG